MIDQDRRGVLRLPAELDRLYEVLSFIRQKAEALGVPDKSLGKLDLVMEELTVNVMHYAYPDGSGAFEISFVLEEQGTSTRFCVTLRDWGKPFNPLASSEPDRELPVEERPVGGLGIFLAEQMVDSLNYQRKDGANVLTFCFDLAGE
jgi:anti-sigma regulatory factor (Ser/Thr protein kinase)